MFSFLNSLFLGNQTGRELGRKQRSCSVLVEQDKLQKENSTHLKLPRSLDKCDVFSFLFSLFLGNQTWKRTPQKAWKSKVRKTVTWSKSCCPVCCLEESFCRDKFSELCKSGHHREIFMEVLWVTAEIYEMRERKKMRTWEWVQAVRTLKMSQSPALMLQEIVSSVS